MCWKGNHSEKIYFQVLYVLWDWIRNEHDLKCKLNREILIRVTVWIFRDQQLILKKNIQKIIVISEVPLYSLIDIILMCTIRHKIYILFGLCFQTSTAYSECVQNAVIEEPHQLPIYFCPSVNRHHIAHFISLV